MRKPTYFSPFNYRIIMPIESANMIILVYAHALSTGNGQLANRYVSKLPVLVTV